MRLTDPPFENRTGRGVTIAILDSGVHAEHPHLSGAEILAGRSFADESDDVVDRIGHGTAVAAAIHEKAPDARLMPVKLFHRHLSTNAEQLARAIEWAADNGAQLINLSLGTSNAAHAERLEKAVDIAGENGAIIVAARESSGTRWYPGSPSRRAAESPSRRVAQSPSRPVIGVLPDAACERDEIDFRRADDGSVYVAASIYPRPIPDVPRERNLSGISFAVANASGFLARALETLETLESSNGRTMADIVKAFC